MKAIYGLFSPRWAAEPVICFRKGDAVKWGEIKKAFYARGSYYEMLKF